VKWRCILSPPGKKMEIPVHCLSTAFLTVRCHRTSPPPPLGIYAKLPPGPNIEFSPTGAISARHRLAIRSFPQGTETIPGGFALYLV
jgi:hypothetical protein